MQVGVSFDTPSCFFTPQSRATGKVSIANARSHVSSLSFSKGRGEMHWLLGIS